MSDRNVIVINKNPCRIFVKEKGEITAYYFSVPVYKQDGKLVDLRWKKTTDRMEFEGINAKIISTENRTILQNEDITLKVAFEQDVSLEPTYNGVMVKVEGNKARIIIETDIVGEVKANDTCFAFMKDNLTPYFSVSCIVGKEKNGKVGFLIMEHERDCMGNYQIMITGGETFCEMMVEINLYAPKLIFDTTINERNKEQNNSFGGVAFLSNGDRKEELYSRFNLAYLNDLNLKAIKTATLCIPAYAKAGGKIRLRNIEASWCSVGMNWNQKQIGGRIIDEKEVANGYVELDITRSLKEQLNLKTVKSYGVIISNPDTDTIAVSTGDNYYKPQILKIKYKGEE